MRRVAVVFLAFLFSLLLGFSRPGYGEQVLLGRKDVLNKAAKEIIPATARQLRRGGWPEEARIWAEGKAKDAVLVWAYIRARRGLQPTYWLVSVFSGRKLLGLLALDPYDGHFSWRARRIPSALRPVAAKVFTKPEDVKRSLTKELSEEERQAFALDSFVLGSINGIYYWVVPPRGRPVDESLSFPVGTERDRTTLRDALGKGRGKVLAENGMKGSGPPFDLQPTQVDITATEGTTWLVNEVPIYYQGGTYNCWCYCLAMVHQWWSPIDLGTGDHQAEMIRSYMGMGPDDSADSDDEYQVMQNWQALEQEWEETHGPNPYDYEDFHTIWFGEGQGFGPGEGPSWESNDPKSWIAWEAPVLAFIDSDGGGSDAWVDHDVVIVGYDAENEVVYVNNPWGYATDISYEDFNNKYWGAKYDWVWCDCFECAWCFRYTRKGMVAGVPGYATSGLPQPQGIVYIPPAVFDADTVHIAHVRMQLQPQDIYSLFALLICGGSDAYGEDYRLECRICLPQAQFVGNLVKGGWSGIDVNQGADRLELIAWYNQPVSPLFSQVVPSLQSEGGGFDLTFSGPPAMVACSVGCRIYSCSDRTHYQDTVFVTVHHDYPAKDGSMQMRKPLRVWSAKEELVYLHIHDDDSSPPIIQQISPGIVVDTYQADYRFKVRIQDPSGVDNVRVKWSFSPVPPSTWQSFADQDGDFHWLYVARDEWLQHVGGNIYFWVTAQDKDADWSGDESAATQEFVVQLVDDDPAGPVVVEHTVGEVTGEEMEVLVQLEDASGIDTAGNWPELYYGFSEDLSVDNYEEVVKLNSAPQVGEDWFSASVPWGGLVCATKVRVPQLTYLKVHAKDLDSDRPDDQTESWSETWSLTYCWPLAANQENAVDVEPSESGEIEDDLWDHWVEKLPFEDVVLWEAMKEKELFFEGPPPPIDPPPVPERIRGGEAKLRLHFLLTSDPPESGLILKVSAVPLNTKSYQLDVSVLSAKASQKLGTLQFSVGHRNRAEQSTKIPAKVLSQGENILVLQPSGGTGKKHELTLKRITVSPKR